MQYLSRRLIAAIPVLIAVSIVVFAGVRFIPGDECFLILQTEDYTQEQCDAVKDSLGLNRPAVEQYFHWVGGILQGDFGESYITRRSPIELMKPRLGPTVELAVLSITFALIIGIPAGVMAAVKHDSLIDHATRVAAIGWLSLPNFWIATMLIVFPSQLFGYSSPVGFSPITEDPLRNLEQMAFPVLSLGVAVSANIARFMRSSMLEVLREDYVRTARAKGLQDRVVIYRHALKNAMLPVVTLVGLQFGTLLGGTVILESIYGLPGLGTLLLGAVSTKDYLQIQTISLFFAVVVIVISLLVDLSYSWFDPRVSYR